VSKEDSASRRILPVAAPSTVVLPLVVDHAFYNLNGRLAMFRPRAADKENWEQIWSRTELRAFLDGYRSGKLEEFEDIFTRYLPKGLPILEAGCGRGQLVMALSARGYDVQGVDYADSTVARIREVAPQLKVRTGDIYKLDAPDETYGGYISIGLFEHNPEGPHEALKETRRVLHSQGVALISVPYLNSSRSKLLQRATPASGTEIPEGLSFYQYYFSRKEFEAHIKSAGLKVIDCYPYGVYTGLVRDSAFWGWFDRSRSCPWFLHYRFIRWCANAPRWLRFKSAHMLMFACQRTESP
jgi:SAM-dependent methyltransferase